MTELIGSFLLVFMYLCSTEEKTKFTKDNVVQTMVLASAYLSAMFLAGNHVPIIFISPVNPAIALCMILFNSTANSWKTFWIFTLMGFIGSLAALLFFRVVYIRTKEQMDEVDDEDENNKGEPLMG